MKKSDDAGEKRCGGAVFCAAAPAKASLEKNESAWKAHMLATHVKQR
jgi:hypothetical protein